MIAKTFSTRQVKVLIQDQTAPEVPNLISNQAQGLSRHDTGRSCRGLI